MRRWIALMIVLMAGAIVGHLIPGLTQSNVVYAQCTETVPGKNISSTGTMVCDCTITQNTNCNCVVPKKCGGGEYEEFELAY